MDAKRIKFTVLFVLTIASIVIGVLVQIENFFSYVILTGCFLQGVMSIFDYIFDFPMNVGTARILDPKEKNKMARFFLLLVALALMAFSIWWFFNMPL